MADRAGIAILRTGVRLPLCVCARARACVCVRACECACVCSNNDDGHIWRLISGEPKALTKNIED